MQTETKEVAFRDLYDREVGRVYRLSLLYLGNVPDAEDAVQNIFLKVLEKKTDFQDENHEKAWFLTVTRNYCRDVKKSFWNRMRVPMEAVSEPVFTEITMEESIVYSAMTALPKKYREVLYLYYYEEYSVREMSAILKRKESTIQTQLATARKQIQKALEQKEIREEETC